jgi:uncharacterized protein
VNSEEHAAPSRKPIQTIPSSGIHVDQEGDWYYHEDKITREDIIELFLAHLELAPGGLFYIDWRGQRCAVEAADTPFVITRVDRVPSKDGHSESILLQLKHLPTPDFLNPSTLWIGADNIPYCTIRNGRYRARFARPAYYQLAAWIEHDPHTETFFLELNDTRYPIAAPCGCLQLDT